MWRFSLIVKADTLEEARAKMEEALGKIEIEVEEEH